MQQPVGGFDIAESQVIPNIRNFKKTTFNTFHEKGNGHSGRDGIQTVFIAVPVVLHNKLRIKNPHVADSADSFVFRTIDINIQSGQRPASEFYIFRTFCAGQIAPIVAAVRHFPGEVFIQKDTAK